MTDAIKRLRAVLATNAASSALAGLAGAIAAGPVDRFLGSDHPGLVRLVGIGLLVFALDVAILARSNTQLLTKWTPVVSVADWAWVLASAVLVLTASLRPAGIVSLLVMAVAVAGFAWQQQRLARAARATRVERPTTAAR